MPGRSPSLASPRLAGALQAMPRTGSWDQAGEATSSGLELLLLPCKSRSTL